MLFINLEDFYEKVNMCVKLSREEEIDCAKKMSEGDLQSRERIIESYLPMVAGHIKHMKPHLQTLGLVLYCTRALEKAVDSFDFLQDSETFTHRLSWWLRDVTVKYITR